MFPTRSWRNSSLLLSRYVPGQRQRGYDSRWPLPGDVPLEVFERPELGGDC